MDINRSETQKANRKKKRRKLLKMLIAVSTVLLLASIGLFIWKTLDFISIQDKAVRTASPEPVGKTEIYKEISIEKDEVVPTTPDREDEIILDFVGDIMLGSNVCTLL